MSNTDDLSRALDDLLKSCGRLPLPSSIDSASIDYINNTGDPSRALNDLMKSCRRFPLPSSLDSASIDDINNTGDPSRALNNLLKSCGRFPLPSNVDSASIDDLSNTGDPSRALDIFLKSRGRFPLPSGKAPVSTDPLSDMSNTENPSRVLDDLSKSCRRLSLPSGNDSASVNPISQDADMGNTGHPLSPDNNIDNTGHPLSQDDNMGNTGYPLSQENNMSNNLERFSKGEDEVIIAYVHQRLSWAEISDRLSGRDCRKRYHTHAKKYDIVHWRWTSSEEQFLFALCTQTSQPNWERISKLFMDRSIESCQRRWRQLGKAPIGHEKPWTEQEIQKLSMLHAEGTNWVQISENLTKATGQTRTGSECMRRLRSEHALAYPSPVANGNYWTMERTALVETLQKAGETWEYISRRLLLPADECRGFWHNSCWEDYRLCIREDGTLHMPLYKDAETA